LGKPVVIVKKKDGTDRFCVDYRKVNSVTEKMFTVTSDKEIFDNIGKAKIFSTLDLDKGYWQSRWMKPVS